MKSTIALAIAILCCSRSIEALGEAPPGGLANSPWPDYGGGLRNTHLTTAIGPAFPVQILWQYSVSDVGNSFNRPFRQPVLGEDGTIYFGTYTTGQSQIIALRPDGSLKWNQILNVIGFWLALDSNGRLYHEGWTSSSTVGAIFARSQSTGSLVWSKQYQGVPLESGPTVGNDGTIYTAAGGLTALNQAGQQLWQVSAGEHQYRNPAIAADGTIYVDGQFVLSAVSPTGATLWTRSVGKRLGPIAIDGDGDLYVGTANESAPAFYSFTSTGAEKWHRNDLAGAAAIGPSGTIYAQYGGTLHAIEPDTGVDLWSYATGPTDEFGTEGVTIDALGNIYLTNQQGILMSLTSSGALRWQFDLAPNYSEKVYPGAPVIGANGVIYVAGGMTRMFFALVVPEPSTILLIIAPFAILAARHRKQSYRNRGSR